MNMGMPPPSWSYFGTQLVIIVLGYVYCVAVIFHHCLFYFIFLFFASSVLFLVLPLLMLIDPQKKKTNSLGLNAQS